MIISAELDGYILKPRSAPESVVASGIYGSLVGVVNGPLSDADNNHVLISIHVTTGVGKGVWKIAFNVESESGPKAVQYRIVDENVTAAEFPPPGFLTPARLSYATLGLKTKDFKAVTNGTLRTLVHSTVARAERVQTYGFTFPQSGLHDVHYNNGEPTGSGHANHPGQDGALAVYYHESTGQAVRRWIFIKFQTQTL